jgi:hypothetical protein
MKPGLIQLTTVDLSRTEYIENVEVLFKQYLLKAMILPTATPTHIYLKHQFVLLMLSLCNRLDKRV